jgi:hypothetical protein
MKITLPIFFLNKKTTELTEAGIEYDMELDDILNVVFYNISTIAPYPANKKYCRVYSNGNTFVCAKPMKEVEIIIDKKLAFENILILSKS